MLSGTEEELNVALRQMAESLDISPNRYREAMDRYASIKEHLEKREFSDVGGEAHVYLQGSFRLGTVVRPYRNGKDADYDVDAVCEIEHAEDLNSPATLKWSVGREVKGYAQEHGMKDPDDKRRCWTLKYAGEEEIGFHIDILPAIPNPELRRRITFDHSDLGIYSDSAIAITNRDDGTSPPEYTWRSSNADGYARWFYDINQPGFVAIETKERESLFEKNRGLYAQLDDVPSGLVRTPLQRVVQILKRHRDVYFTGHKWEKHKPISMIITTLVARLLRGNFHRLGNVYSAMDYVMRQLRAHATLLEREGYVGDDLAKLKLIEFAEGRWYIANPVNPQFPGDPPGKGENFADRWHENGHLPARAFFEWINAFHGSFTDAFQSASRKESQKLLESSLRIGTSAGQYREGGLARTRHVITADFNSLARFDVAHRQRLPWQQDRRYSVVLTAEYERNGRWQRFLSDCAPLPKHRSLLFTARTSAPSPFQVYWQVVNTGEEAARVNGGLRGQIFPSKEEGLSTLMRREERTEYKGMHWIECFIVKGGKCVARSGEFVVNIE